MLDEGASLMRKMERLKAARAALEAERVELLKERGDLLERQADQLRALANFNERRLTRPTEDRAD